jgi:hypothetical protein
MNVQHNIIGGGGTEWNAPRLNWPIWVGAVSEAVLSLSMRLRNFHYGSKKKQTDSQKYNTKCYSIVAILTCNVHLFISSMLKSINNISRSFPHTSVFHYHHPRPEESTSTSTSSWT